MSKKLPKATAQTLDDIRRERDGEAKGAPEGRAGTASAAKRRASPKSGGGAKREAPPPPPGAASTDADPAMELRQARAGQIVERFTAYSAVGSIIPLPLLDIGGVVLLNIAMVKALAKHYEAPFDVNRVRAAVAGLIGGLGQAGVGTLVTASLAKATPGAAAVGAAASSAASALLTRTIGRAFLLHFETGGTALAFDAAALRGYFERVRAVA